MFDINAGYARSAFSKQRDFYLCPFGGRGDGAHCEQACQDVELGDLMDQLSIPKGDTSPDLPIYFGGPVEHGRGFVLHGADYKSELSTMKTGIAVRDDSDNRHIGRHRCAKGPERALIALGYAGWGPGQLEQEIAANGWLLADVGPDSHL